MKKSVYILLSIILGFLVSTIVHAAIEIPILMVFIEDFDRYGMGFGWGFWIAIHHALTVILTVTGIGFGYLIGKKWHEKGIK